MDLPLKTIAELSALLSSGEVSPLELTEQTLARIEVLDDELNSFITVTGDLAREEARRAEAELREGRRRGPLHGIPYAAKDLFFTRGIRTTSGSKVFSDFVPDFDSTVVTKLREAGAVLIGKTGMHEHAYGITSTNPHFGAVRNPWDIERIPGGSSGGSTAALSAGLCSFSLGTDTGGSIRIPASFCNVSGLKPTFGRVSRHGVFPLGHTFDHMGPFAVTVQDTAWAYEAMAGVDAADESTVDRPLERVDFSRLEDLRGRRIGVPRNFYFDDIDPQVEAAARDALRRMEQLGADLVEVTVPDIEEFNAIGRLLLLAEATSVHIRNFEARYEDYGEDQRALHDQGRMITAVEYLNAQRRRRQLNEEFYALFEEIDAIAAPAVPVLPAPIGAKTLEVAGRTDDVRLMTTRNVRALNMTGLPLLSLPCGFSQEGLPIGFAVGGAVVRRERLARDRPRVSARDGLASQAPPSRPCG